MNNKSNQSIGIFDSGIGGLTIMREIINHLPQENIIYFGDTARLPYGGKSPEAIIRFSIENAIFLMEHNIKLLVIACNTASAYALEKLQRIFNIPVLGVIEPGAEQAISITQNKQIAVLGTRGTISSGVYPKEIQKKLPEARVVSIACPLFVPLVEQQFLHHPVSSLIVKKYLKPLKEDCVDTLLLGCTHYLLLKKTIMNEIGEHVNIVDSASRCSQRVSELLKQYQIANPVNQSAKYHYYVSDDPIKFQKLGIQLLGMPIDHVCLKS